MQKYKEEQIPYSEAYNKGLEDAWGVARKIFTTDCATLQKVLGSSDEGIIIMQNEPQAILAKLDAYENEQSTFKVGDVVEPKGNENVKVIITSLQPENMFNGMDMYGRSFSGRTLKAYKKTGKHIDISELLQKIGGVE